MLGALAMSLTMTYAMQNTLFVWSCHYMRFVPLKKILERFFILDRTLWSGYDDVGHDGTLSDSDSY